MAIITASITTDFLKEKIDAFIALLRNEELEYWREEEFLRELPFKFELSVYAARKKEIVGYIIASKKDDLAYIHKFMVVRRMRGVGIGHTLLNHFYNLCILHGLNKIHLCVYKSNVRARRFYYNNGFISIGERVENKYNLVLDIMEKCIVY